MSQAGTSFREFIAILDPPLDKNRAQEHQRVGAMPQSEMEKAIALAHKIDEDLTISGLLRTARPWWYKQSRRRKHLTIAAQANTSKIVQRFALIYADPPTPFETYNWKGTDRTAAQHYPVLTWQEIENFKIDGRSMIRQQAVDAFDERRRRFIVGDRFERSRKPAPGFFPVPRPIGGEPFGIRGPKQCLRGGQGSLTSHNLEHGLRCGLANHNDPVDLADLDVEISRRCGGLGHQHPAVIDLVCALEARRQVYRVAHHGVAHHELGPDAPDQRLAGRNANAQVDCKSAGPPAGKPTIKRTGCVG